MQTRNRGDYTIAGCELVAEGADLRVQVLSLAAGQCVPWHYHSEISDSFVCLEGPMVVETRAPRHVYWLLPRRRRHPAETLRHYERLRLPRVTRLQEMSRANKTRFHCATVLRNRPATPSGQRPATVRPIPPPPRGRLLIAPAVPGTGGWSPPSSGGRQARRCRSGGQRRHRSGSR